VYNNWTFGSYVNTNSFYHSLNPVTKLLLTVLTLISVLLINSTIKLLFLLFILLIVITFNKLSLKTIVLDIWRIKYFILFTIILNLLFGLSVDDVVCLVLKIIIILANSLILTMTTSILEITNVFNKFLYPLNKLKINVNSWSLVFSLSLCLIPMILKDSNKIINSQVSRGLNIIKNKFLRIKSILIPIFILSFRKSNNIANYLELSFFSDSTKRTNYRIVKWTIKDISVIIIYIILLIINEVKV